MVTIYDDGYCYRVFLKNDKNFTVWGKNKTKAIKWFLVNTDKYNKDDILKVQREWTPPLCGVKWLQKHKDEHADFIPSIEITIDNKTKLNIKGNIPRGKLKEILR
jgi:hypothetical protein